MESTAHDEEGDSEATLSLHGSTTHPYRSLLTNTSFPRCHLVHTPETGPESFARSMFSLGHGYPIWSPIGDTSRPPNHLRDGIRIGDVGLLTKDGDFRYYFNIFLPATDPVQKRCPSDFEVLHPPPEPSEIVENPMQFPRGTALVSKGVSVSRLSESPLDLEFKVNAREGGIIIFPEGASRTDLISTSRLLPYVKKHALNWYRFINELTRDVPHPNGTLYLITGCDSTKASSWAVASGTHYHRQRGQEVKTRYRGDQSRPWESSHGVIGRSDFISHPQAQNCAIFIRGMRIAVSPDSWTKHVLGNQPPAFVPHFNLLSTPLMGFRAQIVTMMERWKEYPDRYRAVSTEIIFHPISIICRILLDESPTAAVAIAEDSLWSSVSDKQSDGTLPEIVKRIAEFLETHDISTVEGLTSLIPKISHSESRPSDAQNVLFRISDRIRNVFITRRQRREILRKIARALPGPDYQEKPVIN